MSFNNTRLPLKPKKRGKWQIEKKGLSYVLTEEQEALLREYYPKEMNPTLMKWFGISYGTLYRLARERGMKKDMSVIYKKHARQVKRTCEKNGYYARLKGRAPSEACREAYRRKLETGWNPQKHLKETDPKKFKRVREKTRRARLESIERDRKRIRLGLDQKTKMHLPQFSYTKGQVNIRYIALKRGYILGDTSDNSGERYTIYYDEGTTRSDGFEKTCGKHGMTIKRLPEIYAV